MGNKVIITRLATGRPGLAEVLSGDLPEFPFYLLATHQNRMKDVSRCGSTNHLTDQAGESSQTLAFGVHRVQIETLTSQPLEKRMLYQDLREANAQLVIAVLSAQNLQAKAERELTQQKNVLVMVAHELRNPLTPISIIAERMVRLPSDQLPRMRELIESQVQQISQLVDDLLDVSRASSGKLRIKRRDVDIMPILASAVERCGALMMSRKHHFEVLLPKGVVTVNGDPGRLAQILHNLLANAPNTHPLRAGSY